MKYVCWQDFTTFAKDYIPSHKVVEDDIDYKVTHYFNEDGDVVAKKIEQEIYDEVRSYGWDTTYFIEGGE